MNSSKYPLDAFIDFNTAMSTYLNSSSIRPRIGDKIEYKNKEYFVTSTYYINGRTLLDFYKENSVFMGVHISQVKFISRSLF